MATTARALGAASGTVQAGAVLAELAELQTRHEDRETSVSLCKSTGSAGVERREPGSLAAGRTNHLPVHDPQRNRAGPRRSGRTPGAAFSFAELPGPLEVPLKFCS